MLGVESGGGRCSSVNETNMLFFARKKVTAKNKRGSMPTPARTKRMRPVAYSAIEFNGEGTTRFFYDARPTDDLEVLLATRRAREIKNAFMRVNVGRKMVARMDAGVRVNRALARGLGVKALSSPATEAYPLTRAPRRAKLVVFGEPLEDESARGLVLTAIVLARADA